MMSEKISFEDLADIYKSELFDNYGYISLGYKTFTAGEILEKCDPVMFNSGVRSYAHYRDLEIV
jgi:hypothetical protein